MTAESGGAGEHPRTAGELVEPAALLSPGQTVAGVLSRGPVSPETTHIAVCEDGVLLGLVETALLLGADQDARVESLMRRPRATVTDTESAERAAFLAAHQAAETVAVLDDEGRFLGFIPAHRLLALMVHEHEIDLARLGGFLRGTSTARTASEEAVGRRVWHRAPWLLIGLAGAVIAARVVSAFENDLADTVALAFFLPGIVYMADAVGTQTETLVIRGLSVGISPIKMLRLEALTGALIGVLLSLAIFPLALLLTDGTDIALIVSLSLLAASSCATLVAVTLPFLLQKLKFDPAFGSGPLATVIQDILSIAIYFGIAVAVLN